MNSGPQLGFTDDDRMNPVFCIGCRTHIPKAVSNSNRGLCPACVVKMQTPAPPPIQAPPVVRGNTPTAWIVAGALLLVAFFAVIFVFKSRPPARDVIPAANAPVRSPSHEAASPAPSPTPQVTYLSSRIVPWVSAANGRDMQMVLISWRNTGSTPIAVVEAQITAYDAQGQVLESSVPEYTIFASESMSRRIQPGMSYIEPEGEGFVLIPGVDGVLASRVEVRITKCSDTNKLLEE